MGTVHENISSKISDTRHSFHTLCLLHTSELSRYSPDLRMYFQVTYHSRILHGGQLHWGLCKITKLGVGTCSGHATIKCSTIVMLSLNNYPINPSPQVQTNVLCSVSSILERKNITIIILLWHVVWWLSMLNSLCVINTNMYVVVYSQ